LDDVSVVLVFLEGFGVDSKRLLKNRSDRRVGAGLRFRDDVDSSRLSVE